MEKDKKYKVTLEGWGMHSAKEILTCGSTLTEKEAKQYLKDLVKTFNQAPKKSCFVCMEAQFSKKETKSFSFVSAYPYKNPIQKTCSKALELHLASCLNCTDTERKCLNNIKNGKCPDKFIVELIGKRFFPAQYTSEKQK